MKQRCIYVFIFGFPGILISAFAAIFAGGATAGFLWFNIFGVDVNEWAFFTQKLVTSITVVVFVATLSFVVRAGFIEGKRREVKKTPINNRHILMSVAMTVVLALLMIIFQRGYIFKEPASKVCQDLCIQKGYDGNLISLGPEVSGKSTCSCWNNATKKHDEVGIID